MSIISYFFLCTILLFLTCNFITSKAIAIIDTKKDIHKMRDNFYELRPEVKDVFKYSQSIKKEILSYSEKLEAIEDVLSNRIDLGVILRGFRELLIPGSYIDNFYLSSDSKTLVFDVIVSANKAGENFNAGYIAHAFRSNKDLMSYIKNIESSKTYKKGDQKEGKYISEFLCSLR
ncbi:MAG: hypothetical protein ABIG92_06235 [Candidatus Omnitrophota bacterium]